MKNTKKTGHKPEVKNGLPGKSPQFLPYLLALALTVVVFFAYTPALNKEFVNYDDDVFVVENPDIANFSMAGIPGIFTHFYKGQYSPVPTVIYGLTHEAGGFDARYYNFMGVLFHLINVFLVFWLAFLLSGKQWISLFIAALFGLHPVQVESVAWLATVYKVGLYGMFFLASLLFYVLFSRQKKSMYYLLSILFFILSCFSKEQAVILTIVLPLMDYITGRDLRGLRIWLEKIPFLLISLFFGILTLFANSQGREQLMSTPYSLAEKLAYAAHALTAYFYNTIVPVPLWLNYRIPDIAATGSVFYLNFLTIIITTIVLVYAYQKKNKWLGAGLLFFIVNLLLPLFLAVISIREAIVADRYLYIPILGAAMLMASLVGFLIQRFPKLRLLWTGSCLLILLILGTLTHAQVKTWKNSEALVNHIIRNQAVPMAYVNRSELFLVKEDFRAALNDCNQAIALDGRYYLAYLNRGICHRRMGLPELAMEDYSKAISLNPSDFKLFINRGNVYYDLLMDSLAILDYKQVLLMDPGNAMVYANLGAVYFRLKKYDESLFALNHSIRLNKRNEKAFINRSILYESMNKPEQALEDLDACLNINPENMVILNEKGRIKEKMGDYTGAIQEFSTVLQRDPGFRSAYVLRAQAYARAGEMEKARLDITKAKQMGASVNPEFEQSIGLNH